MLCLHGRGPRLCLAARQHAMKPRVEAYSFGAMTIAGRKFTSDLILHPDGRIQDNWWRRHGHLLLAVDIADVIDESPRKLIIGTGAHGRMNVSPDVFELCRARDIEVEACPTGAAAERFNEASGTGAPVAACFHLTC